MPLPASALERDEFLRLLLMGVPKSGKTTMVVASSPGPVRVLLCEGDSALNGARRHSPEWVKHGDFERIKGWKSMADAIQVAKEDAKKGVIKTLVVDPLSDFAAVLEEDLLAATDNGKGPDGRRAYPEYVRRLRHLVEQLFRIPCHVVVISHYIEVGGGEVQPDGGGEPTPRTGEGIVPLLAGKARALIAAKFNDVVWFDIRKGERILETGPTGRWGPGCRSLDGVQIIPADVTKGKDVGIRALIKAFREDDASVPKGRVNGRAAVEARR